MHQATKRGFTQICSRPSWYAVNSNFRNYPRVFSTEGHRPAPSPDPTHSGEGTPLDAFGVDVEPSAPRSLSGPHTFGHLPALYCEVPQHKSKFVMHENAPLTYNGAYSTRHCAVCSYNTSCDTIRTTPRLRLMFYDNFAKQSSHNGSNKSIMMLRFLWRSLIGPVKAWKIKQVKQKKRLAAVATWSSCHIHVFGKQHLLLHIANKSLPTHL